MKNLAIAILLVATLNACQTVSRAVPRAALRDVDVPEEALRQAAVRIEENVVAGRRDAPLPSLEGLNLDTETIRQAVRARVARAHLVTGLLENGYAYEGRNGLIVVRGGRAYRQETTSEERRRHALVVYSENQDRWALYEGIPKANKWPGRTLNLVQDAFRDARIAVLGQGQLYEDDAGDIVAK